MPNHRAHGLQEILREVSEAFTGSASRDDLLALAGAIVHPTKWGLYDRDALETWVQGRICPLGDAAHPMLPTFGQGAAQSFEDAAALASAFALHGPDVATAMLHYERVRHYRATRFQLGSKFTFDHLRAKDTAEQKALLETLDERVSPAFAHDKRGGEDDSWIYAYDARNRFRDFQILSFAAKSGPVGREIADLFGTASCDRISQHASEKCPHAWLTTTHTERLLCDRMNDE